MKKKTLVGVVVGMLLATGVLSMLPPQTNAAMSTDVSVDDIECTSGSVNYDTPEIFRARVFNEGNTAATEVKIGFYLDGTFRNTTEPFNVSAGSSTWSPEVTIHWPSDYWCHKLSAKLLVPYTGECEKWFRATLAVDTYAGIAAEPRSRSGDDVELVIEAGENSDPYDGHTQRIGLDYLAWVINYGDEPVTGYWNLTFYSFIEGKEVYTQQRTVPFTGAIGHGGAGFSLLPELHVITVSAVNESLTKRAVELFGVVALSPPIDDPTRHGNFLDFDVQLS